MHQHAGEGAAPCGGGAAGRADPPAACAQSKRQQTLNELRLLCDGSTAGVRGVVTYVGCYFVPEDSSIAVALELMELGSLDDVLRRCGRLPEPLLACVCADVLQGLAWLHAAKRTIHRDIKPGNILLAASGEAKVSDFGIATCGDGAALAASGAGASCAAHGTLRYMAPERLAGRPYGYNADVWSLGLSLAECGLGAFPLRTDGGPVGLIMEVLQAELPANAVPGGSAECADFLALALCRDEGARPSAEALACHPWPARRAAPHAAVAAFAATARHVDAQLVALAQMFVAHFYGLLDRTGVDREALAALYAGDARLCVAGGLRAAGPYGAVLLLGASLGGAPSSHAVAHVDVQAWGEGGVLALVSGSLLRAFESSSFSDAFCLTGAQGVWHITHHWRSQGPPRATGL